jgi:hypothetical protein
MGPLIPVTRDEAMKIKIQSIMRILSHSSPSIRWSGCSKRAIGLGLTVSAAAVIALAVWLVPRAPAGIFSSDSEVDQALQSTLAVELAMPSCPSDPAAIEERVAAGFAILHPDLAIRELRKDPAYRQAEAVATSNLLDSKAILERLLQDPAYRQRREQAIKDMTLVLPSSRTEVPAK